jgi:hypothetical protein
MLNVATTIVAQRMCLPTHNKRWDLITSNTYSYMLLGIRCYRGVCFVVNALQSTVALEVVVAPLAHRTVRCATGHCPVPHWTVR